jgi:hypothetical protein
MMAVGLDLTTADFSRVRSAPRVVAMGLFAPLVVLPVIARVASVARVADAEPTVVPAEPGAYDGGMTSTELQGGDALRQLVDEYRGRCLWFLRPDYHPETTEEVLRVLGSIQRHGDVDAFRRAGEFKRWALASSNAPSATSSQTIASGAARATSPAGPR